MCLKSPPYSARWQAHADTLGVLYHNKRCLCKKNTFLSEKVTQSYKLLCINQWSDRNVEIGFLMLSFYNLQMQKACHYIYYNKQTTKIHVLFLHIDFAWSLGSAMWHVEPTSVFHAFSHSYCLFAVIAQSERPEMYNLYIKWGQPAVFWNQVTCSLLRRHFQTKQLVYFGLQLPSQIYTWEI